MLNNNLRFGIVQGRLTQSPIGQLQYFPQDSWEKEFSLAASLGINYIELIAERVHNPNNPIWSSEGISKIKNLANQNKLSLYTFCNDYIIDNCLINNKKVLEQNIRLISQGALLGCKKFILPLFERSELTADNLSQYIPPLRYIAEAAKDLDITVCLETILDGYELIEALDKIDHPSLSAVFDTGNRVAFGHKLPSDIRLLSNHISHVHIKDKNKENENVILGTGLVNFLEVFEALAEINYTGSYTFESQRGKDPLNTALYNMQFVNFFYRENFSN